MIGFSTAVFARAAGPQTPEMHIPDGFLSLAVSLVCWAVTIGLLGRAVRRTQASFGERQIPLMGIMAAFIFAAQMINFPVAGGTSGHLLGGALAAITLGPWAAMLVMACVIGVQGLLFQDGGLIVMGANILNMGLLTSIVGYGVYRSVIGRPRTLRLIVAGLAAWLSVMTGALATSLQLWLSGTSPLAVVLTSMLAIHALIGLGEALITVAALGFVERTRPDLLENGAEPARGGRGWVVAGLAIALAVVVFSPLASADPDGLERAAEYAGFLNRGQQAPYQIIPDYSVPILGATPISTIVAGVIGALAVFVILYTLGRALRSRPA
jgi:cobalt/nickel transport system permease protein